MSFTAEHSACGGQKDKSLCQVIILPAASYIVTKISNLGVAMKDYIEDRVIEISQYIIDNNSIVRAAAKVFNVKK